MLIQIESDIIKDRRDIIVSFCWELLTMPKSDTNTKEAMGNVFENCWKITYNSINLLNQIERDVIKDNETFACHSLQKNFIFRLTGCAVKFQRLQFIFLTALKCLYMWYKLRLHQSMCFYKMSITHLTQFTEMLMFILVLYSAPQYFLQNNGIFWNKWKHW